MFTTVKSILACGVTLSALALGCAAPVDEEPSASASDPINVADLRVRVYNIHVELEGARACSTPGCNFRVRVKLINSFRATLAERCSVVLPGEVYSAVRPDFGALTTSFYRPGFPGFADAAWMQLTLEEGQFATTRQPSRKSHFNDDCNGGGARTVLDTGWRHYDHDRDARGSTFIPYQGGEWLGAAIQVSYATDALFDLGDGTLTLTKTPSR